MITILGDVDEFEVVDEGYVFKYVRILDPNGDKSKYFSLHYRNEVDTEWETANGILSKNYSVAKTSEVVAQLKTNIGGRCLGDKHYRHTATIKHTFVQEGFDLLDGAVDQVDKILFALLTDVSIENINKRTTLCFSIINGYAGNHCLEINHGLLTGLTVISEGTPRALSVSNSFILDSFTKKLVHSNRLEYRFEEASNIKIESERNIEIFKDTPVELSFMDGLRRSQPKKFTNMFFSIFDKVGEEYNNMYYACYILSFILDSGQNIARELKLRRYVKQYMKDNSVL